MVLLNSQQIQPLEPGAATPGQSAIISANNQTADQSAIISAAKGGTKKRGGAATGQVLPPLYGAAVSPAMQQQNYNAITASGADLELANQQRQQHEPSSTSQDHQNAL